jgi:hypothetical protein
MSRRAMLAVFALLAALSPGRPATAQAPGDASLAGGTDNAVSAMQGALLSDPTSREQVLSLQDDADVQAILKDPATMRAINAGDLGALMSDPKVQVLLNNPKVRGLVEQQAR